VWGTHESLIIHVNDGATSPMDGPARGDSSSSFSALDIAFEKLNLLELGPDHRLLHLETASGYDSAVMSERVGSHNLTTIEYDAALAVWGGKNLDAAGCAPTTVCADGLNGWETTAPCDRIIATAAVRAIPDAWRHQAADHALIRTPYQTAYASGGLLKLTVEDGVAAGRFAGPAFSMPTRAHRPNRDLTPPAEHTKSASHVSPASSTGRRLDAELRHRSARTGRLASAFAVRAVRQGGTVLSRATVHLHDKD
jgi:protein-L-isoaspartate O-methyltransferase